MTIGGNGAGASMLVIVSPIVIPVTPAMATMSPSWVMSISVRFSPLNENSFVILICWIDPSRLAIATSSLFLSVPLKTRAIARRPR